MKNTTIKAINIAKFLEKFGTKEIDLVEKGLFTKEDLNELSKYESQLSLRQKVSLLPSYFLFGFKNPGFFFSFIVPKMFLFGKKKDKIEKKLKERQPIKNNILKSSIISSFDPKVILEIGTYLGWGAASLKTACPHATVYSLDVKINVSANNPITENTIGYFFKKKRISIMQLWGDSLFFNFKSIPNPDVIYIDGNHSYKYVYNDLEKSSKIVKKCIVVDDFITKNSGQLYGPWNEGVVLATMNFLKKNGNLFKDVYWIKNSPYCILIKSYE